LKFTGVAKSLEDDMSLISSFLHDCGSDKIHDNFLIVEGWGVLGFVELISNLGSQSHILLSFSSLEHLSPIGVILNMLLNNLVYGDIDHVELDCQVCTCGVNTQSLLVIKKNDLWTELLDDELCGRLNRLVGVNLYNLNSIKNILEF